MMSKSVVPIAFLIIGVFVVAGAMGAIDRYHIIKTSQREDIISSVEIDAIVYQTFLDNNKKIVELDELNVEKRVLVREWTLCYYEYPEGVDPEAYVREVTEDFIKEYCDGRIVFQFKIYEDRDWYLFHYYGVIKEVDNARTFYGFKILIQDYWEACP
jgi:hypothetical protein